MSGLSCYLVLIKSGQRKDRGACPRRLYWPGPFMVEPWALMLVVRYSSTKHANNRFLATCIKLPSCKASQRPSPEDGFWLNESCVYKPNLRHELYSKKAKPRVCHGVIIMSVSVGGTVHNNAVICHNDSLSFRPIRCSFQYYHPRPLCGFAALREPLQFIVKE